MNLRLGNTSTELEFDEPQKKVGSVGTTLVTGGNTTRGINSPSHSLLHRSRISLALNPFDLAIYGNFVRAVFVKNTGCLSVHSSDKIVYS